MGNIGHKVMSKLNTEIVLGYFNRERVLLSKLLRVLSDEETLYKWTEHMIWSDSCKYSRYDDDNMPGSPNMQHVLPTWA